MSSERTTMVVFLYIALAGQVLVFGFLGFGRASTPDDPSGDATGLPEEAKEDGQDILDAMKCRTTNLKNFVNRLLKRLTRGQKFRKLMQMNIAVPQQHLPLNLMTGASAGRQPRDARGALFAHDQSQALSVCVRVNCLFFLNTHTCTLRRIPASALARLAASCGNFHKEACTCPSRRQVRLGHFRATCHYCMQCQQRRLVVLCQ